MMSGMIESHPSAEAWKRIIREQHLSGLSAAAFCRQAGVRPAAFYFWRRKLRSARRSARVGRPRGQATSFVEVRLPDASPPARRGDPWQPTPARSGVELRLPGRRRVVLRPGFDRHTLRELLAVLEDGA